jgi:hypothetical protein
MTLLRTIFSELWGLFVDDGNLVVAVIAWILADAICLRAHVLEPVLAAILLPVGIVLLLRETVIRSARRQHRG